MLKLIRKHGRNCIAQNGFSVNVLDGCECPYGLMGKDRFGRYHNRESLNTNDLIAAEREKRKIEEGETIRPTPPAADLGLEKTLEMYRAVLKAKGRKESTIELQKYMHDGMVEWMAKKTIKAVDQIQLSHLLTWFAEWKLCADSAAIRISFLRGFFQHAVDMEWIKKNPAKGMPDLKRSRPGGKTAPFELDEELPLVVEAIPYWETKIQRQRFRMSIWMKNPRTASALVYLLRYTGLRISDAYLFNPHLLKQRVVDGEPVWCYFAKKQKKTDQPVFLPIADQEAAKQIMSAKWLSEKYAFWDGKTKFATWNRGFVSSVMTGLGRVSGVDDIHPHRFRDTFAVDLLTDGVDPRAVSRLLGHTSVKTTMDSYEHWVRNDQDKLAKIMVDKARRRRAKVIQMPEAV